MFYPKLFNDDFFDDFFDFPRMRMPEGAERKLYGKHVNGIMKTDVRDQGRSGQSPPQGALLRRNAEKFLCRRRSR